MKLLIYFNIQMIRNIINSFQLLCTIYIIAKNNINYYFELENRFFRN